MSSWLSEGVLSDWELKVVEGSEKGGHISSRSIHPFVSSAGYSRDGGQTAVLCRK